ncbi:MAG: sugar phosphate isomerase/epimerase [Defluviitaleaceae bacterium]|nr:sugar phosphate isomerase/epimerase [Defluviitaleaceae bacterium]
MKKTGIKIYGFADNNFDSEFFRKNNMGVEVYTNPKNLESFNKDRPNIPEIEKIIKGISGISMHGTHYEMTYASNDPWIVDVVKRRFIQCLQAASFYGINHLVFHSSYKSFYGIKGTHLQKWYINSSIDFWREFEKGGNIPDGITILLENAEDNDPEVLAEIIHGINSPKICCCFDIGHAYAYSSIHLNEWIRVLGNKIKHVHLSDNDGKDDLHLPLGKGKLPVLDTIHNILEHTEKDIPFVLECDMPLSLDWLRNNNLLD